MIFFAFEDLLVGNLYPKVRMHGIDTFTNTWHKELIAPSLPEVDLHTGITRCEVACMVTSKSWEFEPLAIYQLAFPLSEERWTCGHA